MDLVFVVCGHRKMSEVEVVNEYSHRQAMMLAEHVVKDRFMVASELLGAFGGSGKQGSTHHPSPPSPGGRRKRGLPSWYRAKPGSRVVDLDGPMSELAPYLGKGALKRGGTGLKSNGRRR